MNKLKKIIAYWPWIVVFMVVKYGSIWHLLSLNAVGHAIAWGTLCAAVIAAFSQKGDIVEFGPAGSEFAMLKFIAAAAIAIIFNAAYTVIYFFFWTDKFGFFGEKFWAYFIGSNCLILLFLVIIPASIIELITYNNADGIEQTDFNPDFG